LTFFLSLNNHRYKGLQTYSSLQSLHTKSFNGCIHLGLNEKTCFVNSSFVAFHFVSLYFPLFACVWPFLLCSYDIIVPVTYVFMSLSVSVPLPCIKTAKVQILQLLKTFCWKPRSMKSSFQQPSQQMVELELRTEILQFVNKSLRLKRRAE